MSLARPWRQCTVAAVVVLLAAACGSSGASSGSSTTSSSTTSSPSAAGGSNGAGETTGISSSSVTVGNVSILSGPVPGLFQGAPYGVSAFIAYQNSIGGVNGRKLVLAGKDDAFSCTNNQSETQQLTQTAFAMVGSFSLFDNCGAKALAQVPDMPDVSYTLDPVAQALRNNFSPAPSHVGWRTGPLLYYKRHYPNAIKAVGTLVGNVPSAVSSWNGEKAAMEYLGYHIAYQRLFNPVETDFTSDILRMRQAGVEMLALSAVDTPTLARILNAAAQQNWHPQLIEASGIAYAGNLFKLVNPGAANGLLNDQQQAMFLGQDANTTPEVKLFDTWMKKTHPGFTPDLFSLYGWDSAMLFTQALQAAGPNPTRSGVLAALRNIHSFNANGLIAPADPAAKTPPTCWIIVKVTNGTFQRYASPAKGFRCDGGYYYAH